MSKDPEVFDLIAFYREEIDTYNFAIDNLMAVLNGETTMAARLNKLESRVREIDELILGLLKRQV